MNAMAGLFLGVLAGVLLLLLIAPSLFSKSNASSKPAPTPEWKLPTGLYPEDLAWLEEQADLAEFRLPAKRYARGPIPQRILQMPGGHPVRLPTPSGLLEISGTWYQKYNSINGSYLKEVAAPPSLETKHEESTTVRDIAGCVIAEHQHPRECGNRLPHVQQHVPAGLDADQQQAGHLVAD